MKPAEAMQFCKKCDRLVAVKKQPIQHDVHWNLVLLTLGCWLPIWLIICLCPRQRVCAECGGPVERPTGEGRGPEKGAKTPRRAAA